MTSQRRHRAARVEFLKARPIAHRGLHDSSRGIVENSRSAFAAAMARNYSIECDLQLTRDGEAVVFHDETLERLTVSAGHVLDLTAAELAATPLRGSTDRIQTLTELLAQVDGAVPLVIEIKSHWDGNPLLARRALACLERYSGPYCLMSFDPDIIAEVHRRSPATPRGVVADRGFDPYYDALPASRRRDIRSLAHLAETRPDFLSLNWEDLPWAPVSAFRALGNPVITWTIQSDAEARQALKYSDQITFEGFLA